MRAYRIFIVAVVIILTVAAWHGQCGIFAQGLGFELRGPVTFGGYTNERPIWTVGKGLQIIAVDPTLHKRLAELEGQKILITVERISPNK